MPGRQVKLLYGAWRPETDTPFDGLRDEHDLERVLIQGVLASPIDSALRAWAEDATSHLTKLRPDRGWKRAFRVWNAPSIPRASRSSIG
jgi:hypothetical protein